MTSNRFFVPKSSLGLARVELEGREHHHLSRVVRVQAGERIWPVDEEGGGYYAEVEGVGEQSTRLRSIDRQEGQPPALCAASAVLLLWNP